MRLDSYTPACGQLREYIEAYYFLSPGEQNARLHYLTFPNNFFIVSVSLGAKIEISENKIHVTGTDGQDIISNYVSRYTSPIEVTCEGNFSEITLYFKPLAINHFIEDVAALYTCRSGLDFNPFDDFQNTMREILQMENREDQKNSLEKYWLSKLKLKEAGRINKILKAIESERKIEELAAEYGMSRQYLNRLFIQWAGKSPSEYRKIHRFRNAIAEQRKNRNLTELSHSNLFYDQSHLIKDFKQLTSIKPNSFFKQIDPEKKNIWLFI
jgi:AraC-like DNA-binding protein